MAGGYRLGSGRPKNSGKYSLPTKVIRIPAKYETEILDFIKTLTTRSK